MSRLYGIECPQCYSQDSTVQDSRPTAGMIRRRRRCLACQSRWTTYEGPAEEKLPNALIEGLLGELEALQVQMNVIRSRLIGFRGPNVVSGPKAGERDLRPASVYDEAHNKVLTDG